MLPCCTLSLLHASTDSNPVVRRVSARSSARMYHRNTSELSHITTNHPVRDNRRKCQQNSERHGPEDGFSGEPPLGRTVSPQLKPDEGPCDGQPSEKQKRGLEGRGPYRGSTRSCNLDAESNGTDDRRSKDVRNTSTDVAEGGRD